MNPLRWLDWARGNQPAEAGLSNCATRPNDWAQHADPAERYLLTGRSFQTCDLGMFLSEQITATSQGVPFIGVAHYFGLVSHHSSKERFYELQRGGGGNPLRMVLKEQPMVGVC